MKIAEFLLPGMKKIIIFIIVLAIGAWVAQNYTNFKAIDLAKKYYQQIDFNEAKTWLTSFNIPGLSSEKKLPDPELRLNVFIRDGVFLPNKSPLKQGAKVTWYNEDTKPHTVTGEGWGSPELAPGKAYTKTFDLPGTYAYHCTLHPSMRGEIIIN